MDSVPSLLASDHVRQLSPTSSELASTVPASAADRNRQALLRKLEQVLLAPVGSSRLPPKVGRFSVVRKLGRGGMGDVYFARDERLGREVALKLLRTQDDPINQARFERGAQAMARLSHPNVVQLHEIGDAEGVPFIVMEFVDGLTLEAWLESPRPISEVIPTFIAAGNGLVAAHEGGLVHRDFKPGNVMLGQDGRVLVTDFGLARGGPAAGYDDVSRELRVAGLLTGTPAYMAPEQFTGSEVDARTDQFSFCVALWEAVYGQRPFHGANIQTLAATVLQGRPSVPEGARAPRWLRRALERGLAVEPSERWPSLQALLDTLASGIERRRWRWLSRA